MPFVPIAVSTTGEDRPGVAERPQSARQALLLGVLLSVLLGVLPALFTEPIVAAFRPGDLIERQVAEDYFLIMSHGAFTGLGLRPGFAGSPSGASLMFPRNRTSSPP